MTEELNSEIQVFCRFRPLNDKEIIISNSVCVDFPADQRSVTVQQDGLSPLIFRFDRVFTPNASQEQVYQVAAQPIIESVMQGFNGTVIAYGQTSSGKTFTMAGPNFEDDKMMGIIPRMVGNVFEFINFASESLEFTVKVSYCEIYMEKIKDLIDPSRTNLKIHEEKLRGIYIDNLSYTYVNTEQDLYTLLTLGNTHREVAQTQMNNGSSRSHSIFIVLVSQTHLTTLSTKLGKLYLVDLAGSEKVSKTGASGKRLEEAKTINKSLTVLGKVISSLTDNKSTHVPYRDSKLTRVLQDSLGGNSRTSLIITCSPSVYNLEETISTLRFGVRAKSVKNKPRVNKEFTVAELKLMLARAQEDLEKKNQLIQILQGKNGDVKIELSEPGDVMVSLEEVYEEMEVLKEKLENESENCEELRNIVARLENFNQEVLLDNASMVAELKSCHEEILEFKNLKASKDEEIAELKNSNCIYVKQIQELNKISVQLQQDNQDKEEEIQSVKKLLKNCLVEIEELQTVKNQLFNEQAKTKSLADQLELTQNSLKELTKQKIDIEKLRETLTKEIQVQEASRFNQERQTLNNDLQNRIKKVIELEVALDDSRETLRIIEERMSQGDKAILKRNNLLTRNIEHITDLYYKLLNERSSVVHDNQVLANKVARLLERITLLEEQVKIRQLSRFEEHSFVEEFSKISNSIISKTSGLGLNIRKPIIGGGKYV